MGIVSPRMVVGARFNRLVIVEISERPADHVGRFERTVVCRCDCGTVKTFSGRNVGSGNTQSCGCFGRESRSNRSRTHGASNTPLYRRWHGMIERCTDPANKAYPFYGGRGITVCCEWRDFAVFSAWCHANGFSSELKLDRIDNQKGYSPDNCQFVKHAENMRNTRRNIQVTAFGETKCLMEWERDNRCFVSRKTIKRRVEKGWTPERAISAPPETRNK